MSITRLTKDIAYHQKQVDEPNDVGGLTADALKALFDQGAVDIKDFINNTLIPALESIVDGSSGADNIGATAITGLSGTTVQAILESLRDKLKSTADNSSGADFIGATEISGLTGTTVQALLEALKDYIDTDFDNKTAITNNRKLSASGNFTGSWHGISSPALADPGIAGVVQSHSEQLADIVYNEKISTATGNGIVDDTISIQNKINEISINGGGVFKGKVGKIYSISSTVIVPQNVDVDFNHATIKAIGGGTFINGFIFAINSTDCIGWTIAYPQRFGYFKNVKFDGNNINNVKCVFLASPHEIYGVFADNVYQIIQTINNYLDNFIARKITLFNPKGSLFQIDKQGQGDGCNISNIHVAEIGVLPYANLLNIYTCNGGKLDNIINGKIVVNNSSGISIDTPHLEKGVIEIIDSNVEINSPYIWHNDADHPIKIIDSENLGGYAEYGTAKQCIIRNPIIEYRYENYDYNLDISDINIENFRGYLKVEGGYRRLEPTGLPFNRLPLCGLSIKKDGSSEKALYSSFEVIDNEIVKDKTIKFPTDDGYLELTSVSLQDGITWLSAIGTYYYRVSTIYDTDRMIGIVNAGQPEVSVNIPDTTKGVRLNLQYARPNGYIRVYRGITPGSYDKYVDIPNVIAQYLFDNGIGVNGYLWQTRIAGGIEDLNSFKSIKYENGSAICIGIGTPWAGAWKKGDIVYNVNPQPNTNIGWVCTGDGSVGSWKTFGAIAP